MLRLGGYTPPQRSVSILGCNMSVQLSYATSARNDLERIDQVIVKRIIGKLDFGMRYKKTLCVLQNG